MAPRDFQPAFGGIRQTTPDAVARRGLYEEVGFSSDDIDQCHIGIHSLAWAADILDYKFFGVAITSLSRAEVQERWRNAPDHRESMGTTLPFMPARRHKDRLDLLRLIKEEPDDWAPEAVFSTIRSLLTRRLVSASDIVDVFGRS